MEIKLEHRNLKEKYETDTYLFLDIDKTLIKQFMQIKIRMKLIQKYFDLLSQSCRVDFC
jgi:hypothetical protein